MSKGPRKGTFSIASLHSGDVPPREMEPGRNLPSAALAIVSSRGYGAVSIGAFDFGPFSHIPLIAQNQGVIRAQFVSNKTEASLNAERYNLASLARYVEWYRSLYGTEPTGAETVDRHFCYELIVFLEQKGIVDAAKAARVRFFRRFMEAIGVDGSLLPANPFPTDSGLSDDRPALSPKQLRTLLNQAKFEARVVQQRLSELEKMGEGHDPRRAGGGRNGDWDIPECRLWIMKNVFNLEIRNSDEWRFEKGLTGEMRGLEGRPGASIVTADGQVTRQVGWKGHLRWFFPWSDDIAPFVVLILIRTGLNLGSVAAFRAGREWCKPFPFRLGEVTEETHVYIETYKTRGRGIPLQKSKLLRLSSSIKPWSYPYRVLETVEKLTANLRCEILRRLNELLGKGRLTGEEQQEFIKLDTIKEDLFIYKTEQGISSLAWHSRKGLDIPRSIRALLARAGLDINISQLRDAPLLFWYSASGQNLFVVQMLAGHARPETSTLYMHRKILLNNLAERGKEIFNHSIDLIRAGSLDIARLRGLLRSQQFSEEQIESLVDERNTSRWGNRCASPSNPPLEFAEGTEAGGLCRRQDCIDGCPSARWFHESLPHIAKQLVMAEQVQASLGLESTDGSSIGERIARCHELLSQWPEAAATEALKQARQDIGGSCDIFLGASL